MKTVLIVDDEPLIRNLLVDLLIDEGYTVLSSVDGLAAQGVMAETPVDLVLTDTMMPRCSGPELIQWMRGSPDHAGVPVILTSAAPSPDISGLSLVEFVAKPFTLTHLLAVVEQSMAGEDT
jgi:CheY-like chemotaxis protein